VLLRRIWWMLLWFNLIGKGEATIGR